MAKSQMMEILSSRGDDPSNTKPRNYYIWGFQPHFETSVEMAAKSLFKKLDPEIRPNTFLVAINSGKPSDQPAAVVEPEDHGVQPDDFKSILKLVAELEVVAPGPAYCYEEGSTQGEAWAKQEERRGFIGRVRRAIKQIVEGSHQHDSPKVYVSPGREVGPYFVYSVLLIEAADFDAHPALQRTHRGRYSVTPSLIDAVANTFVDSCWEAILSSFAGQGRDEFPTTDSLLRAAATTFMYTPFGACENFLGMHGGFETCNEISTLTYETTSRRGRLILAKAGHENVSEALSFHRPPKLRDYRAIRKLLQLAGENEGLICDSEQVLGVGTIFGTYNAADEDLFCVEFLGHSKWELTHGGIPLMRVEFGLPQLPKKRLQVRRFTETFTRLFPQASDKQKMGVSRIATAATELSHGAIVIVAENAAQEAIRFGNQSTVIEPKPLSDELLEKASRIDGAMLVSPDGLCHAIGVILDGQVNEKGTADRGARFNSTIRYVYGSKSPCLGLVVSDDGMVDIVPEFRPRIMRRDIECKLQELRDVTGPPTVNRRVINKLREWLEGHQFYLSQVQCSELNELLDLASRKSDGSGWWVEYPPLKPNPEMNDSYFQG